MSGRGLGVDAREAGDGDVSGVLFEQVHPRGERSASAADRGDPCGFSGGATGADFNVAVGPPIGGLIGNGIVDDVDHAPDCGAAIKQGARATEDLHARSKERLNGCVVVGTDGGCIQSTDAVVEDANPVAAETSDHRAASAGAVVGGAYARRAGEGFAYRGLDQAVQFFAGEHGSALGDVKRGFGIVARAHDEFVEVLDVVSRTNGRGRAGGLSASKICRQKK